MTSVQKYVGSMRLNLGSVGLIIFHFLSANHSEVDNKGIKMSQNINTFLTFLFIFEVFA
jgi:hypothetical protein